MIINQINNPHSIKSIKFHHQLSDDYRHTAKHPKLLQNLRFSKISKEICRRGLKFERWDYNQLQGFSAEAWLTHFFCIPSILPYFHRQIIRFEHFFSLCGLNIDSHHQIIITFEMSLPLILASLFIHKFKNLNNAKIAF